MNPRTLRFGNLAAAAVLIGGVLVAVLPQYAMSVVQLVIVTVATAAALYALIAIVPVTWWRSPFDRSGRPGRKLRGSDELDLIRSKLSGRRHPIENGRPLPPGALHLMKPLIRVALERENVDPDAEAHRASARALLSPLTWAIFTSDPSRRPHWFRTFRSKEREVADIVHAVLDDLDRLASGGEPPRHIDTSDPGET